MHAGMIAPPCSRHVSVSSSSNSSLPLQGVNILHRSAQASRFVAAPLRLVSKHPLKEMYDKAYME